MSSRVDRAIDYARAFPPALGTLIVENLTVLADEVERLRAAVGPSDEVLAADKNGDDCSECVPGTDDFCAYHQGYADGADGYR